MLNIVEETKLKILYDPVINLKEIIKKDRILVDFENYYISVGRLTIQKIFYFYVMRLKN